MIKMLHVCRPRRFQRTWFGVNRLSGCGVKVSARFQEPSLRPWVCPLCPHGQITITLHIYRPRRFQRTWFGVNRLSGYKVTASAIFQSPLLQIPGALITPMGMPIWPQRAIGRDVAHLEAETVPIDLIWSESAQWLLSYGPDQRADRRTERRVDWRWGGGHSIIHLLPSERAGDKNIHLVLQTGKYFFYCKSHSLRSIIIKSRCWLHDEYYWHNFFNINITLCCLIR